MKRVVFFGEGAWEGVRTDTNVYKMFRALKSDPGQAGFYDGGEGAEATPPEAPKAGSYGDRLFQKIRSGYAAIARLYVRGDDIFLFGAGRGAYTVRCIAGMIATCGLPTRAFDDGLVNTVFQAYRNPKKRIALLVTLRKYAMFDARVRMLGVWETVGARGIPPFVGNVDPLTAGFFDTHLHPRVLNACQAFAIDERRRELLPTLWKSSPAAGQVLEQAFLAGVLHDVVRGYPAGVSDITLDWMMGKAESLGLTWTAQAPARCSLDIEKALPVMHKPLKVFYFHPAARIFLRCS